MYFGQGLSARKLRESPLLGSSEAEDSAADVFLVRQALTEHKVDCEIRVIGDGEKAIAFIDELDADSRTPCLDLFLLDLHLPKRDGDEVLKHLRSSVRSWQTPVIVLTSSDSPRDQQNVEKYSAVHYFRKPSSLSAFMELGALVKTVVDR